MEFHSFFFFIISFIMSQITNIDRCAHQARMLHIQGRVEESIALYIMKMMFIL